MRGDHDAIEPAPADDMDFAVHHSGAGGAARHFHIWQDLPGLAHGIVFKRGGAGLLVDVNSKAAQRINLSGGGGDSQMIARRR